MAIYTIQMQTPETVMMGSTTLQPTTTEVDVTGADEDSLLKMAQKGKVILQKISTTSSTAALSYSTQSTFPIAGVVGLIYVALDTGNLYLWSTTQLAYVQIGGSSGGSSSLLVYANISAFPAHGSSNYLYLAQNTNYLYVWSSTSSAYVQIGNYTVTSPISTYSTRSAFPSTGVVLNLYIALDTDYLYVWSSTSNTYIQVGGSAPVSSVLGFSNRAGFPSTGTANILYIALDTGYLYTWANSAYGQVGVTPANISVVQPYATRSAFPGSGTTNAIYLALDTGYLYTWASSAYAQIGGSSSTGGSSGTSMYSTRSAFPATGATNTLYVATDTNYIYTWSTTSSAYVQITNGIVSGGGNANTFTQGTTIISARALQSGDIWKLTVVDTSAGAVALTLNTGVMTTVSNTMYFQRKGSNPLTFVSGTGSILNPLGITCGDSDVVGLICTATDTALMIGTDYYTAHLNVAQYWSKAQSVQPQPLTDAATITVPALTSNNFYVTLAGNRTLANPTNPMDGQSINIRIFQDGTGSRTLAFDTKYKFSFGVVPTLTTTANAHDLLTMKYWAATDTWDCALGQNFS